MLPDNVREFGDASKAREWIYDNTLTSVSKRFPVEDNEYQLNLLNPHYDGPQDFSLPKQKEALIKLRQLHTPIKGTWQLVHKPTGTVVEEKEDIVMQVPYLTDRGTFIRNGNEISGYSQSRLKPGPYSRVAKSGIVETFYNVSPGTGKNFRVEMEPKSGVFKFNIGQASLPLYPILKSIGVDDNKLIKTWGPQIVAANAGVRAVNVIDKLYARMAGRNATHTNINDKINFIREEFPKYKLDPWVVSRNLGIMNTEGVTPDVLLRSTNKLLGISRGEEEPDDRDAPVYSNVLSYEDLIKERIDKDAGKLARNLFFKIKRDKSLKRIPFSALNPYIESYLSGSRLTQPLEETNPLHTWEQQHRIVKLGEGGISSAEAVTEAARNVNTGQAGFIDGIAGPESASVGIDVRAAYKTFKGRDQQMYAEFKNTRTNKLELLRPEDSDDKTIAFPSQDLTNGKEVTAIRHGKIVQVPAKEIDYQIPSMAHMFSTGTNSGIAATGMMPARLFYSAKYWSQFMPQVRGEVPLVDTLIPNQPDTTFLEHYGRKIGTLSSPIDGKVIKADNDVIVVQNKDGERRKIELVKDFPFNRLTGISYFPTVKVGDGVVKGGMLAHSNFTDPKTGSINMGVNLRTAIIPYKGESIEDAHVISETAAKKLATSRLYGYDETAKHGITIDKNRYVSLFSGQFTKEQIDKIDDNGIIKPGVIVNKGDPIILATGPKLLSPEDVKLGKLHKALRNAFTNKAQTWDYDYPGIVTDSALSGKSAVVNIKANAPVQIGDKLVTRESLKGVVSAIIPDDKMPQDAATGQPYEILLNPMGVLSRVAPNQLVEIQLSKIAKKLGRQLRIPQDAPPEGWNVWTLNKLKEHGLKESATLFDPESKKYIPNIGDGYSYISAFHHLAEKKLSGRGAGVGSYTSSEQPAHGGFEGGHAKRFGTLDLNAALSHGATEIIRDVINIRGTKNEEYWKALKMGRPLPEPTVPFVYNKFINLLKAGGVNIREKGDTLSLLPMTDEDMKGLSKGDITSSNMVDKNFEPVPGGLFDMGKTGGLSGAHWSTIKLNEPVPNPVFEEPIRRLLGLREKDLYNILGGVQRLDGKTGGMAIRDALGKIDIDREIAKNKEAVTELRGANRDNAIKIIAYLTAIKKQGLHPVAWMINKVPVLPPIFRPISQLGDVTIQSDINELYRDIIETNKNIGELRKDLPESGLMEEKSKLYDSVKAAFGLGDPITTEGASKGLKGAIKQIIGTSPKTGLFQHKVISKPVDVVARGVIAPDPNLDMDSIGIPEDMAWTTYAPFIMRRLVRHGYPADAALQMIKDQNNIAKRALEEEMQVRPVIVDRAPAWHKFNLMAFFPHTVSDKVIRISPLVAKGFNADFDGDAMNFHVPVSDKAVDQAKLKMLPSRNLISLTDLRTVQHKPAQELALGLYTLSRSSNNKQPVIFKTVNDAKLAYRQGKIKVNDPIDILELKR